MWRGEYIVKIGTCLISRLNLFWKQKRGEAHHIESWQRFDYSIHYSLLCRSTCGRLTNVAHNLPFILKGSGRNGYDISIHRKHNYTVYRVNILILQKKILSPQYNLTLSMYTLHWVIQHNELQVTRLFLLINRLPHPLISKYRAPRENQETFEII